MCLKCLLFFTCSIYNKNRVISYGASRTETSWEVIKKEGRSNTLAIGYFSLFSSMSFLFLCDSRDSLFSIGGYLFFLVLYITFCVKKNNILKQILQTYPKAKRSHTLFCIVYIPRLAHLYLSRIEDNLQGNTKH